MDALETLAQQVKTIGDAVAAQGQQIASLADKAPGQGGGGSLAGNGPAAVRVGENPLTSRGYSFLRAVGRAANIVPDEQCVVERDVHNRLLKYLGEMGYQRAANNPTLLLPFATEHMPVVERNFVLELREMVMGGVTGCDSEELFRLRKRFQAPAAKAMSWLDETSGGALVAPPVMGELIDLLRNNAALMTAGARNIPMPPNGRATYPRQTGAMSAYWVGQSATITDSDPTTGEMNLTAKKLGILAKIPNELFRFPSIAVEQFVREDMMAVMGLRMDKSLLEAVGSGVEPKGLLNYAGITKHTASTTGTDGDTFEPEDVASMIAKVEEKNANFKAWIMRPLMYSVIANRRADAVSAGDKKGAFLFNMLRDVSQNMARARGVGNLESYPCVKSTNVGNDRKKGSATNLTYILAGDFADMVIATSGVIEFLIAREGDTAVQQDQTWVRGIHYCDGAPRREASFVVCDELRQV